MNRTEARAAAMKLIYEWDMGGEGGDDTLSGILEVKPGEQEYKYMRRMVDGVQQSLDQIDPLIERYAEGWKLDRLMRVDLAILRLGAYELLIKEEPAAVVINEAVELSHTYSTEQAGGFINGVLGKITREAVE